MKKGLYITSIIIGIVIIAIYLFLYNKLESRNQTFENLQLNAAAEVTFDEFGIPHIEAESDEDAFKVLGFVHASDRLFQMEMLRRVGSGTLSEILGKDFIKTDLYLRTVGLDDNAKRASELFLSHPNSKTNQNVSAYLEGVNQYIRDGKTPIEFDIIGIPKNEFKVIDIYRILGYMGFGFSAELKNEPILNWINTNLGSNYLEDLSIAPNIYDTQIPQCGMDTSNTDALLSSTVSDIVNTLPVPLFYGSNSWVISGSKTKNGKVLFANDTHIGYSQPSVWYEAHINTPNLNLYGNFLAGVPYPIIGHNLDHSWGLTIFPADAIDLFEEHIENDSVIHRGVQTLIKQREVIIKVKDEKSETRLIRSTPNGPIVTDILSFQENLPTPTSMWWVANKSTDQKLEALEILAYGSSLEHVESASKLIDSPGLNIMYGNSNGDIAWFGAAKLIDRYDSVNSFLVSDGSLPKLSIKGFLPFSSNPKCINPKSGFVYSANNKPMSADSIHYPGYYYSGARAKTISSAVEAKNDWTIEDMKALVMDNTSTNYPANAQIIIKGIEPKTNIEREVIAILNSWDGSHDLESVGPTIYYRLIYNVLKNTLKDEIGEERFNVLISSPITLHAITPLLNNINSKWWNNTVTDEEESIEDIFQISFQQTVALLSKELGSNVNNWRWEHVHLIEHQHALGKVKPLNHLFNVGPAPSPGGDEVLNKIAFNLNTDFKYTPRSGPAMRILLDFGDIENSLSINPTGQSGNFMSNHYKDQFRMYNNGLFRKQKMDPTDIQEGKTGTWTFN